MKISHTFQRFFHPLLHIPLLLMVLGIFLRGYNATNYPFSFDQIQIAKEAHSIANGDFTLIGPRTGPAEMFTGPLIYYIAATFAIVMPSCYAVIAGTIAIAAITGMVLYLLGKSYLPEQKTVLLILWAVSPFLIKLDRNPWNPNLTLLASSLVFFPLLSKKSLQWWELLLISGGVFLGYQAHFSGLLLLPLALSGILYRTKRSAFFSIRTCLSCLFPIIAFTFSLLPTVLFDYRNSWLNWNGLQALASNGEQVSVYSLLPRVWEKLLIIVEVVGRLFLEYNSSMLILSLGLAISMLFLYYQIKEGSSRRLLIPCLTWISIIVVLFAVYRSPTPEYYFLLLFPAFFVMIGNVVNTAFSDKQQIVLAILCIAYGSVIGIQKASADIGLSLNHQLSTLDELREIQKMTPISNITYDVQAVDTLGLQYLLSLQPLSFAPQGYEAHIIFPTLNQGLITTRIAPNVAIWIDSRTDPERKYITTQHYILSTPKTWKVYESYDPEEKGDAQQAYVIFDEQQLVQANLLVLDPMLQDPVFDEFKAIKQIQNPAMLDLMTSWIPIKEASTLEVLKAGNAVSFHNGKMFILVNPANNLALESIVILDK